MRIAVWRMVAAWALLAGVAAADDAGPWLRVNLVGYLPDDPKVAILSSRTPLEGTSSRGMSIVASLG